MPRLPDRRTALGAALIGLAALGVYGWTVGFEFVFDDHIQITRNPWLRAPDGFWKFLTEPFWGFYRDRGVGPSNYYRPVFGIVYSLQARAFGIQPAAFHAVSVLLHMAVSLLVAAGARRLFRGDVAALAAGLLFAVHPAHAEAVAWVAGQADPLIGLFALVALYAYLAVKDGGTRARTGWWAGPLAFFLACLAKEPGAALIVVLFALEIGEWRREGTLGRALGRGALRLAPYVAVLGLYFVLRLQALDGFAPRSYGVTPSLASALAFGGSLLARYLAFLFYPFPTQVLASVPVPQLVSGWALAGLAVAGLALLGLAVAAWTGRARREVLLPSAMMIAFLLPVLAADRIGGSNFAERYLYVPSVGLAWLAGLLWARLWRSAPRALAVAGVAVLVALGAATVLRSNIYKDDLNLFQAAVRNTPYSHIARNNLGMALFAKGRLDEAERQYREALRLRRQNIPAMANLALLEERRGNLAAARAGFEAVLRLVPTHTVSAIHLSRMDAARGDRQAAARRLDTLFAAGGESYDALLERAGLWLQEGRPDQAIPLLERAVRSYPDRRKGREMLEKARRWSP